MITAIMLDQREPKHITELTFGGLPAMVTLLEIGDVMCATDTGETILIERKSPDDFLNSLKDDRLFLQVSNMITETRWSYLVITDPFQRGPQNQVITARGVTGWAWAVLQGALTTIQELGIFVVYSAGEEGFEDCVLSIGRRSHDKVVKIPPAKQPQILSVQEAILASLPGIGWERATTVLQHADGSPAWALCGLTDKTTKIKGIQEGIKKRVRSALGLQDGQQLGILTNDQGDELLQIIPYGAQ